MRFAVSTDSVSICGLRAAGVARSLDAPLVDLAPPRVCGRRRARYLLPRRKITWLGGYRSMVARVFSGKLLADDHERA
jgi:hypothetical protein